jgi:hypothetical protein
MPNVLGFSGRAGSLLNGFLKVIAENGFDAGLGIEKSVKKKLHEHQNTPRMPHSIYKCRGAMHPF